MPGLRERNKAKRRDAILDAALDLLRVKAAASIMTEQIAERAEVSPATVYNLVGTREQLHFALVDRATAEVVARANDLAARDTDAFEQASRLLAAYIEVWTEDAHAWRQVISAMPDATSRTAWMTVDPALPLVDILRRAQAQGRLRPDADAFAIGQQAYLSYVGAMFSWMVGAISNSGFQVAAHHGLLVALLAAAADDERPELLVSLAEAGAKLSSHTGADTEPA